MAPGLEVTSCTLSVPGNCISDILPEVHPPIYYSLLVPDISYDQQYIYMLCEFTHVDCMSHIDTPEVQPPLPSGLEALDVVDSYVTCVRTLCMWIGLILECFLSLYQYILHYEFPFSVGGSFFWWMRAICSLDVQVEYFWRTSFVDLVH